MRRLKSNSLIVAFIALFFSDMGFAQQAAVRSDRELLLSQHFEKKEFAPRKRNFLFIHTHNPIVKYNPLSLTMGAAMYAYQHVISPQFSAGCLYSPSCSEYSKALIREYGLLRGMVFSADRLTRCNRMAAEDIRKTAYDPADHKVHENTAIYHFH